MLFYSIHINSNKSMVMVVAPLVVLGSIFTFITVICMLYNLSYVNGVPVHTTKQNTGEVVKANVSEQYIVEWRNNSWQVVFMAKGDYGRYRSSNCYSDRYSGLDNINDIIHGLVNDGYFPECPEWIRLNTYTPGSMLIDRVWSAKYDTGKFRDKKFNSWNRESYQIADGLDDRQKSIFRELGAPAVEMLNIIDDVLRDFVGLRDIDLCHIPVDVLSKEEHLLCLLYLDIANAITLSNDGFLIDPEWEDPIACGSCYLEDMIR